MCSGRRRSNGRRIDMEKSPAALLRCRIILCPEFAGAFLLSDRVLRDCTPRALPRASRSGRHVGLRPPRNDNSGAFTILTSVCTFSRQPVRTASAFPRLPRRFAPRNDTSGSALVHQRSSAVECPPAGRLGNAAADATGAFHFNYGLCKPAALRRSGHRPLRIK